MQTYGFPQPFTADSATVNRKQLSVVDKYIREKRNFHFWGGFLWYIFFPAIVFVVFAPGLIFSLPAEENCDRVTTYVNPQKVTWENALVAGALYLVFLTLWFWLGGLAHVNFPFHLGELSD